MEDAAAARVDFAAPATLRKYPSLANQRQPDRESYQVHEGTLADCMTAFMAKPATTRHLYEIQTAAQPPLVTDALSPEHILELARLREFF